MKAKQGALRRIKGLGGEINAYMHRRRNKQKPRIVYHWSDGVTLKIDYDQQQSQQLLEQADRLIVLSRQ